MSFKITPDLWRKICHFASFQQTGVSLQQMALFGQNPSQGTLLRASQFLLEELPVRLAHRVKELDELPQNLSTMPSIHKVKDWYAQSFEELISFPPVETSKDIRAALKLSSSVSGHLPGSVPNPSFNGGLGNPGSGKMRIPIEKRYYAQTSGVVWPPEIRDYNAKFTTILENIKRRHDPTVTTVAQGVLEWKRSYNAPRIDSEIQAWLDRFYLSRIGIRFLIGQHIALNTLEPHPDYVGIICTKSVSIGDHRHDLIDLIFVNENIHDIVQESIENARFVCETHYGMFKGPPVQLICPKDLHFSYVPGHLSHICFELLKNSLRAVVERFGPDREDHFPPIKVIVVEGKEDITIKISDEGGGIPRSAISLIWTYMYTTMKGQNLDQDFQTNDFRAPMAGFGYGLPLSRLYARYFGGDLMLISIDGFGTDVYIHLNRLSSSQEPLP